MVSPSNVIVIPSPSLLISTYKPSCVKSGLTIVCVCLYTLYTALSDEGRSKVVFYPDEISDYIDYRLAGNTVKDFLKL